MAGVELEWLHALPVSLRNVQVPVLISFREREGGAVIYEHSNTHLLWHFVHLTRSQENTHHSVVTGHANSVYAIQLIIGILRPKIPQQYRAGVIRFTQQDLDVVAK